jgi:hypothetical protein
MSTVATDVRQGGVMIRPLHKVVFLRDQHLDPLILIADEPQQAGL